MATPDMNVNEKVTDETGKLVVSESTAEVPRIPTVSYEGRYRDGSRISRKGGPKASGTSDSWGVWGFSLHKIL